MRKRAAASAQEVLGALQRTAALAPASEAIVAGRRGWQGRWAGSRLPLPNAPDMWMPAACTPHPPPRTLLWTPITPALQCTPLPAVCARVLPGPAAAAHAAAAAPGKQRATFEAAITSAVSDALHLMAALKQLGPLMAAPSLAPTLDLLFKLLPLRQALLSRHVLEVATALAAAPSSHLPPSQLGSLLDVALQSEGLLDRKAPDGLLALVRLLEEGLPRLAEAEPLAAGPRLAAACHWLVPLLGAEHDGVRFEASQALQRLVREALPDGLLTAGGAGRSGQPPVVSVVAAVGSSMGARYQEAWPLALPGAGWARGRGGKDVGLW